MPKIKKIQKAVVQFAYELHEAQQEVWDYVKGKRLNPKGRPFRFFVAVFGRQTGKSLLGKLLILDAALNEGKKCLWVSPSIPTARKHWLEMKALLSDSGLITKGFATINESAKEIVFSNGAVVNFRSAIEPDNMRGLTIHFMVLDEAAFFRNGEYVWYSVLFPMLTVSRGSALFLTSARGRNWLFDLYRQGQQEGEEYYKSWQRTVFCNPHQDFELLEVQRKQMPSMQWREEFLSEFLSDSGGVFTGVDAAATVVQLEGPITGHIYIMGIDLGFSNDFTCVTVIDITDNPAQQVYGKRWNLSGTLQSGMLIKELVEKWSPRHVYFEKNGIGDVIMRLLRELIHYGDDFDFEEMEVDRDYGDGQDSQRLGVTTLRFNANTKIHAMSLANNSKRFLVESTAAAIEFGRLLLLREGTEYADVQLKEISNYERVTTQSGMGVSYNGREGEHDDTVSALYLACKALPKIRANKGHTQGKSLAGAKFNPLRSNKFSFGRIKNARRH